MAAHPYLWMAPADWWQTTLQLRPERVEVGLKLSNSRGLDAKLSLGEFKLCAILATTWSDVLSPLCLWVHVRP